MIDSLIKNLRDLAAFAHADLSVADEAANEIERLRKALVLIACRKDACHCKHLTGFSADKMCCAGIARSALGGDD